MGEFQIVGSDSDAVIVRLDLESRGADALSDERTAGKWAVYVDRWPSSGLRHLFARRRLDADDARDLYDDQCAAYEHLGPRA